ncbi:MAG: hypothetical protein IH859_02655, partial [Chloroflexi bacterium]|nr:hypothetical protein [Chloroflexota bacterium]
MATVNYEAGERETISIDGLGKYLTKGKHRIKIKYSGVKNALPYTMSVNWNTTLPVSSENCQVKLSTKLSSNEIEVGETVRLTTTLTNTSKEGLPMTMAIVGIPGGLSAQPWQLK